LCKFDHPEEVAEKVRAKKERRKAEPAAVQAALKLDGHKVGERWIKVEQGDMRRSWHALGRQKPENCNTIFVGNLDFNAVEDDLYRAFALCGPIKEVRLNAKKAFAFVQFKKKTAPEKAVALNGSKLCGRPMRIDYAEGKKEDKGETAEGDEKKSEKKSRKRQKTTKKAYREEY